MRILLVEDSKMLRKMIIAQLKPDYDIVGCAVGIEDAFALYQKIHPQLVLMDVLLKDGESGLTAARQILEHDKDACFVFLANYAHDRLSDDVQELGAAGFASKHAVRQVLDMISQAMYENF